MMIHAKLLPHGSYFAAQATVNLNQPKYCSTSFSQQIHSEKTFQQNEDNNKITKNAVCKWFM